MSINLLPSRLFGSAKQVHAISPAIPLATEMLGREHSGTTGLKSMVYKTTTEGPMPSGLELSARVPQAMMKLMNETIATCQGLQNSGFDTTIDQALFSYHLYDADRLKAELQLRESVGQIYTDDGSDERMMQLFKKQHEHLSKSEVMWVVVSCPSDSSPESIARLQNDLTVMMPNIRMVLENRSPQQKMAIAVVLTKLDGATPMWRKRNRH